MLTWMGTVQQQFNRGGNPGGGGNFRGGAPPNFPQSQSPQQAQQQGRRGGGNAAAQPAQAQMQMHLSDYKTVNGMKFPHLIQSGANNETTEELVVKSIRVNPSFRADLFTK